jgi:serine/threonine-protein kinase PpkA
MTDLKFDLPGYSVTRLIGKGGFAKVYLAIQKSLDRTVALKIMEPRMAEESEFCERFLKEGKIVAQLSNHPNIVTIYDVGKHQGLYYMAMEYVPAGTLRDKIKNKSKLIDIPAVIEQIAGALSYAHKKGFIHRDVKPANVLFTEEGVAKLTDFGIAKSLSSGATRLTEIGFTVGTPEYMSPEQTLAKKMDGRTDLYSFGVVVYEMLVRDKPFKGDDAFATALKHINESPPDLPETFSQYQGLLDRLLAKEPEDRFNDADELIQWIKEKRLDIPLDDSSEHTPTLVADITEAVLSEASESARQSMFSFLTWGVGGMLLVLLLGMSIWWGRNNKLRVEHSVVEKEMDNTSLDNPTSNFELKPMTGKIGRLLDVAAAHEGMGRLTEPPGSNACDAYFLILDIESDNRLAKEAVERIGCKVE